MSFTFQQLEILNPAHYEDYFVRHPREIARILEGLIEQRTLISLYPGTAEQTIVTTLLEFDATAGQLILDSGPDEALNARALGAAEALVGESSLDKVKVQFLLPGLEQTEWDGRPAFAAPTPTTLLRLQRRNYFRLQIPSTHQVYCEVLFAGVKDTVLARVLDISAGGLALLFPPDAPAVVPGTVLDRCNLHLPDSDAIACQLRIRSAFPQAQPHGKDQTRSGCAFVDLAAAAENAIQRYVLKVERERIARSREL